ncbi:MAG TPA: hypothetical protein VL614_08005 [Acetobacteraceae bacterium]|jgi:hypothetical protein|nr:hypothetical protein [Acetobacteraceae bacterium]
MADTMDLLRLAEAVAHTTKDPTTERLSSILEAPALPPDDGLDRSHAEC